MCLWFFESGYKMNREQIFNKIYKEFVQDYTKMGSLDKAKRRGVIYTVKNTNRVYLEQFKRV